MYDFSAFAKSLEENFEAVKRAYEAKRNLNGNQLLCDDRETLDILSDASAKANKLIKKSEDQWKACVANLKRVLEELDKRTYDETKEAVQKIIDRVAQLEEELEVSLLTPLLERS
jgi:hypothetical protein